MENQPKLLSGFQDFLPDRMIVRSQLVETITNEYKKFGYLPQETPALEYAELLLGKYGEDEKLIYEFTDKGERHVAMRYDLTVPLGRIIQMYGNELAFPYRRYQIGNVWRADRPGKGRYREFVQIDADIIGDDSVVSDTETLLTILNTMSALNIDVTLRINSRQILNALTKTCNLSSKEGIGILRSIDKFDKIGWEGVARELSSLDYSNQVIATVKQYLDIQGTPKEVLAGLRSLLSPSETLENDLARLNETLDLLTSAGIDASKVTVDPSIARGLDYYTGLIFETVFNPDPNFGSICSGGRYDRLIKYPSGEFAPAIGMSIGLDRLFSAMSTTGLLPEPHSPIQAFIVNFDKTLLPTYFSVAQKLRAEGISTIINPNTNKIAKQLKNASDRDIPFTIIIGPDETKNNNAVVKNMTTGEQISLSQSEIAKHIKESK